VSALFVGPLEPAIAGTRRLFYCPDGPFADLPFPALVLGNGERVVERFVVSWIPAARVLLKRPQSVRTLMGASVFVPQVAALAPLPGASREAQAIADLYKVPVISGHLSGRQTFIEALARSSVVHFAGHAVVNRQLPGFSFLALSSPGGDDRLTASELSSLSVRTGAVVVLAACSSAAGATQRGEGTLSLARPLLAGGAATIVGTLWDVPDDGVGVFVELHRGLLGGMAAADALAAAQRRAIRSGVPVGLWGAITAIGL
jgi:CHAT domain-containing protein